MPSNTNDDGYKRLSEIVFTVFLEIKLDGGKTIDELLNTRVWESVAIEVPPGNVWNGLWDLVWLKRLNDIAKLINSHLHDEGYWHPFLTYYESYLAKYAESTWSDVIKEDFLRYITEIPPEYRKVRS